MNKITNMKYKIFFISVAISLIVVSCGKPEQTNEAATFYKKDSIRIYNVHLESLRINLKDTLFTQKHSQKFIERIQSVVQKQELQIDRFDKVDQKNNYPTIICTDLNNNAFSRGIVFHGTNGKERDDLTSKGCLIVNQEVSSEIIETIKEGSCLFVYFPDKKYLENSIFRKFTPCMMN